MTLFVGEFEWNAERISDAERTLQLADVEADRVAFRHRKLDLVTREILAVERRACSVAQTHLVTFSESKSVEITYCWS